MVLRELAAGTRLLDRAAARSAGHTTARNQGILVTTAKGLHAPLLGDMGTLGR